MLTERPKRILPRVRNRSRAYLITACLLLLAPVVAACTDADTRRREEIAQRLVGTWLQEIEREGLKIRLVLNLEKGGTFQQAVKAVGPDGSSRTEIIAGDWFFDGETFKRRYLTVNGNRVSGIQFASYQFVSLTDTELACVDHLVEGKREVKFRRVPDGTSP